MAATQQDLADKLNSISYDLAKIVDDLEDANRIADDIGRGNIIGQQVPTKINYISEQLWSFIEGENSLQAIADFVSNIPPSQVGRVSAVERAKMATQRQNGVAAPAPAPSTQPDLSNGPRSAIAAREPMQENSRPVYREDLEREELKSWYKDSFGKRHLKEGDAGYDPSSWDAISHNEDMTNYDIGDEVSDGNTYYDPDEIASQGDLYDEEPSFDEDEFGTEEFESSFQNEDDFDDFDSNPTSVSSSVQPGNWMSIARNSGISFSMKDTESTPVDGRSSMRAIDN